MPRRWVVEQTFGWLMRQRRLVLDYETTETSAEAWSYIAAAHPQRPGRLVPDGCSRPPIGRPPASLRHSMTVLIANDTPPAIRGILKRWFVEPKPNVFVGTVNRRTRDNVLEYVKRNTRDMSLLILTSEPNCQGFKIERWGAPDRRDAEISGLWLVAEQWCEADNIPF